MALSDPEPSSVAEARLLGPRSPVPVSVVLLLDVSGSFAEYEPLRQQAVQEILHWSTDNLRPDDVVSVIAFYQDAAVQLAPISVGDLGRTTPQIHNAFFDNDTTEIRPALELARQLVDVSIPQSVVVVTDTIVQDANPADIDRVMRNLNATTMTLIIPDGIEITDAWQQSFSYQNVVRADTNSSTETSLAIARAIAHATGQSLEKST